MKFTHLLEISTTEPRQYRITVVEDTIGSIATWRMQNESDEFKQIGFYDTVEELMKILEPYLNMESSK